MDGSGKEQKGRIDAENEQDAANQLKQMGLFPTSIVGGRAPARGGKTKPGQKGQRTAAGGGGGMSFGQPKIRRKDLTTTTRQLATLLDAGLPLVRALRTLERQAKGNPPLRKVMGSLADAVEGGSTFSEALAGHPKSFNRLFVNMVRAGEASGAMETVLNRLAEFMEKAQRIAGKVKSAMVYPVLVLTVAGAITAGLMIFIVPKFAKMFDEMLPGEPLPGLTLVVIGISNFMKDHVLIMIGMIVGAIILFRVAKATRVGSYLWDMFVLKTPPLSALAVRPLLPDAGNVDGVRCGGIAGTSDRARYSGQRTRCPGHPESSRCGKGGGRHDAAARTVACLSRDGGQYDRGR
jgi:type IV pilus assembly protein PilC